MTTSAPTISAVRTPGELNEFIELPYRLMEGESLWVPPLRRDMRTLLDRRKHPFHEHAQVEYFLARRGGAVVGRIAAIENFAHNEYHTEKIGFFGFLDAEPEPEIFRALLAEAENWSRAKGLTAMRGPCSFSTNEDCGALVFGFDAAPAVMTPWNREDYPGFIEGAGYAKAKDLVSWWITEANYDSRMHSIADKLQKKLARRADGTETQVVVRPLNMKRFDAELEIVRTIYNQAWEKNWGFVPMTRAELDHLAHELRPVVVPEMVQFVEVGGEPVGFAFSLPDYNLILRYFRGRIGLKQLLLFWLIRPQINRMRMLTMGVVESYRNRGIETLLVTETVKKCRAVGIHSAELGWVLEDNDRMNKVLKAIGSRHYRTHRIYEKAL